MTPTQEHNSTPRDVIIVGAARTPIGRLLGALSTVPATELGSTAIARALEQAQVDPAEVNAVIMGQVLQAGAGQNPTKQAALGAGIPREAHTVTVNKVCLSGLTAIIDAARMLRLGDAEVVVAGGMESMSQAPHLLKGSRSGTKYGATQLADHMEVDGLSDAGTGISMGVLTEEYLDTYPVDASERDACVVDSHNNAASAWERGVFDQEIAPVTVRGRKGDTVVERDEGIREGMTVEALQKLRPTFNPDGVLTAALGCLFDLLVLQRRIRAAKCDGTCNELFLPCARAAGGVAQFRAGDAGGVLHAKQAHGVLLRGCALSDQVAGGVTEPLDLRDVPSCSFRFGACCQGN